MSAVLIGIDLGTTVLKAGAFDARTGRAMAGAARRLKIDAGTDGKREQSPADIEAALRQVFRELRRRLGRRWGDVEGLGLAAQGGSAVIADKQTGSPLSPLVLWNDMRCQKHLAPIKAQRPADYWRGLSWRDEPGWGLARITWFRQMHPRWIRPGNIYSGAGDWLMFRLTGQWRQDAGNALQEGCFNVPQRRLDDGPLSLVGVGLDFVSKFRQGHERNTLSAAGSRMLGLPAGLPVVGPYMDHEAGFMAAASLSDRPLQLSLGTAWVGNYAMARDAQWSSPFHLVVPSPVDDGWLSVQPLLTGNVSWDWAIEAMVHSDRRRAIPRLASIFDESLLPPDGLACLPWLNMPNVLWPGPIGAGAFFGISAGTSRKDLLRAVAAAMCYETRRVFEPLITGGVVDAAFLGGGASKGRYFQQLLAALLAPLPISVLGEEDWSGARGALYALSPTVSRGSARRVRLAGAKVRRAIDAGYDRYRDLFSRLYGQVSAGGPVRLGPAKGSEP